MKTAEQRKEQIAKVFEEAIELFYKKNTDYGDAFAEYGTTGIIIRLGDKLKRFTSISNSSITLVDKESLRDTAIDIVNYAAMICLLIDENKNNK